MSYTAVILEVMNPNQWHSIEEVAMMSNIDKGSTGTILGMLANNGIVEVDFDKRYKRDRKYKSKQRKLFRG